MPLSDDDLHRLAELIKAKQDEDCPLADPEERRKHERHHDYIDLAMQRESQRIQTQRSIIEKSLAGLVWSAIVGFGAAVWAYLKDHLK